MFGEIENSVLVGANDQTLAKKDIKDFYKDMMVCRDKSKKVEITVVFVFVANRSNVYFEDGLLGNFDNYELFKKMGFEENKVL